MKTLLLRLLFCSLNFIFCFISQGQDDSVRTKAIRELTQAVRHRYADKSIACAMADKIEEQFRAGAYDTAYNMNEFFYLVTKDLRAVCNDDHVSVESSFTPYPDDSYYDSLNSLSKRQRKNNIARMKALEKAASKTNAKEALLLGDIIRIGDHTGYLQVLEFNADPERYEKCPLGKAASFLSGTDNLIIDLRGNPGGKVRQMKNFISYFTVTPGSYLFLSSMEYRYDSLGHQKVFEVNDTYYSVPSIPRAFFQQKIYVLTDRYTFSAAEGTAYLLKKLYPNTTIIGEPTPGGIGCGIGTLPYRYFDANIPNGYIKDEERNIIINKGGITPDIQTYRDSALTVALQLINGQDKTDKAVWKYLKKMSPDKNAEFPFNADRYTGDFLKAVVEKQGNELILRYDKHAPIKLYPVETDVFTTHSGIREVRFFRTGDGIITGIRLEFSGTFAEVFIKRPVYKPESVLGWGVKR